MSINQIQETSQEFFAALNRGDVQGWLNTLAEDATSHEPVGTPPNQGHEGLLQWLQQSGEAFETWQTTVQDIFVAGNSAAIRWSSHGVLRNGEEVNIEGIDVHEYNADGKIQTVKGYFDPTPIMAAIS